MSERVSEALGPAGVQRAAESAGGGGGRLPVRLGRCFLCSTSEVPHSFIRLPPPPATTLPLTWRLGVCACVYVWVVGGM